MLNGSRAVPSEKLGPCFPEIRPQLKRMRSLVWVASYPKSGSTLLRLFISAYLGNGTVDINAYKGLGDARRIKYQEVSPKPLNELLPYESFYLRSAMLYHLASDPHEQLVKTHCCFGSVMGIELIPQDLTKGALVPVRDPRDIAISYAHHCNITIDEAIELMEDPTAVSNRDNIFQYLSSWSNHVQSWWQTAPSMGIPVLRVPFEGMVEKPREVFKHVAIAIKNGFDQDKFDRAVEAVKFENLVRQEGLKGFIEKPETSEKFFRKGEIGQWKTELTFAQRSRIERAHGEVMEMMGYL